jgi:hypothetical protein
MSATAARHSGHAIDGACLSVIVWFVLTSLGLGLLAAIVTTLLFAIIVWGLPGPDATTTTTGADIDADAAHAHGPHPALEGWIRARRRRGLLGSSSAALADAARRELRTDVTAEEICAAIERADANLVLANARRRGVA